jgi:hypothetical protein
VRPDPQRSEAPDEVTPGLPLRQALTLIIRHPWRHVGRRWNYKSALTSACLRSLLYFSTTLTAGVSAAVSALSTEFWFRFVTAGFYGALTQAFRGVQPPWAGMLAAMVLLPVVAHSLELAVHWVRHTANLEANIMVSVCFTAISTSFNLFAMRQGVLITGEGSRPLGADLRRMPGIMVGFASTIVRGSIRA